MRTSDQSGALEQDCRADLGVQILTPEIRWPGPSLWKRACKDWRFVWVTLYTSTCEDGNNCVMTSYQCKLRIQNLKPISHIGTSSASLCVRALKGTGAVINLALSWRRHFEEENPDVVSDRSCRAL